MKITSITLGGFKGIKNKAVLPLAPITLFFGANSTGKSTILQGLLYIYEILVNKNVNPEASQLTGNRVRFGGFKNLVHGKSLDGVITLGMTVDMKGRPIMLNDYLATPERTILEKTIAYLPDVEFDTWGFELEIAWDSLKQQAFIRKYECYGNHELFCRFEKVQATPESKITYFKSLDTWAVPEFFEDIGLLTSLIAAFPIFLNKQNHALPDINSRFDFSDEHWDWKDEFSDTDWTPIRLFMEAAISQATLAPLQEIVKRLRQLIHLGPLRVIPDANFNTEKYRNANRWYDGKGAWDEFNYGSSELRNNINYWFSSAEGFHTPYELVDSKPDLLDRQYVYVANLEHSGLYHQFTELGVGISQVFPVVTGICSEHKGIFSCEQPELHIHPRWQLVLADMMLAQTKKHPAKMFLMETHSEHVMLRLMRRRRETAEGEIDSPEFSCSPDDVQVIFCEQENGCTLLRSLKITDEGEFDAPWPNGFFRERTKELY